VCVVLVSAQHAGCETRQLAGLVSTPVTLSAQVVDPLQLHSWSDMMEFIFFIFIFLYSPWRIVDDCGGAFTMGAIGGGIFQAVKGFRNSPVVSKTA